VPPETSGAPIVIATVDQHPGPALSCRQSGQVRQPREGASWPALDRAV